MRKALTKQGGVRKRSSRLRTRCKTCARRKIWATSLTLLARLIGRAPRRWRAFLQGAREYALSVQDANLRNNLIASLATAYAFNGQIPEATEAAMRLPTVEEQHAVLRAVL